MKFPSGTVAHRLHEYNMASSSHLIRSSLRQTLMTLHRCFVSSSHLRLSEQINQNGDQGQDSVGEAKSSAVGENKQGDVEGHESASLADNHIVEADSTLASDEPSHTDTVSSEGSAAENLADSVPETAEETKTDTATATITTESGGTPEEISDNVSGFEQEKPVEEPPKPKRLQQEEGLSEGDVFLQSTFEDQEDEGENYDQDGEGFDSDEYYDTEDEIRIKVLDAALNHVSIYGWSTDAIAAGAEDVGLSSVAEGMFKKGGGDLVLHFIENCNIDLAEHLAVKSKLKDVDEHETHSDADVREFLKDALKKRLELVGPHVNLGTWPQAMGLMLLPQNAPSAIENAAHMVDEIWYHAGDTSTDVDWYMKRGALAALYGATELYMLRDRSDGFQDTWQFLDRRLHDIHNAAQVKNQVEQCAKDTAQMASVVFSMARNLMGINSRTR